MSARHPIILDRGEKWGSIARFLCSSRTFYTGSTALEAYEHWVKRTRAGRWHHHKFGFDKARYAK